MGRLNRFAHVCKKLRAWAILAGLALFLLAWAGQPAQSQYVGTVGQASTVSSFTYPGGVTEYTVGVCTATVKTNCIKMIGQASHALTINYPSGGTCDVFLEGSLDGATWEILSRLYFSGGFAALSQNTGANGFYPLVKLRFNPSGIFTCGAMSGVYTGLQTPFVPTGASQNFWVNAVSTPVDIARWLTYTPIARYLYLVDGFQCYNPDSTTTSAVYSGTYTSGGSISGSLGDTCTLSGFNGGGSGAAATVALTATDTIAGGTALHFTADGTGFAAAPTLATLGNGTATCSGSAVVSTALGPPIAFLELYDNALSPPLGTKSFFYEVGIPPASSFSYTGGKSLFGAQIFWAAAATASNGTIAVSTPLVCNFQVNYSGPFAPFNPFAP